MGVTCTITPVDGSASTFSTMSTSNGRHAKFVQVGSEHHVLMRFHPFGVTGNYIVRGGRDAMQITVGARYVGPLVGGATDPNVMFRTDCSTWSNQAVTIVDESNQSFNTCNLISAQRVTNPLPIGRGTTCVSLDVIFTFTWDA